MFGRYTLLQSQLLEITFEAQRKVFFNLFKLFYSAGSFELALMWLVYFLWVSYHFPHFIHTVELMGRNYYLHVVDKKILKQKN